MADLENKITLDSSQYEEAAKRVNEVTEQAIKLFAKNKRAVDSLVKSYAGVAGDALASNQEKIAEASKKMADESEKAAKKVKAVKKAKEETSEAAKLLINSIEAEAEALKQLKQIAQDGGTSLNALDTMHLKLNGSIAELVGFSGRAVASLQIQRDAAYDAAKAQEALAKANAAAANGNDTSPQSSRFNEWVKEVEKGKAAIAKPVDLSWIDQVNAKAEVEFQKTRNAQAKMREEAAKVATELKALVPTQELVNFSTKAMGISGEEYRSTLRKLQEQAKAAGWSMDALAEGFLHASDGQYKLITMNGVSMAETAKLTNSARAYGLTLEEQEKRTQSLRDVAYRHGSTMTELVATYLKVTNNSYQLVDANGKIYASLEKNVKGTQEATKAQKAFISQQSELKANLTKIASMTAMAFSFRELVRASDEMTAFSNKVRNAVSSLKEFREAKQGIIEIAAKTGQELSAVGDIYQSIRSNLNGLNISQSDAIKLTETLSKAVAVNGASAQATSASLYQLSQSFASGQLRGEELNSVLKQTPEIANAIAEGMNVPVGSLKQLASQGKLTGEEVARALLKASDTIDGRFANSTKTISMAMTELKVRFYEWVDGANNSTGAGEKLAKAISFVADNINILATSAAAFIALKMAISIIKTTVEVVNFGKSVVAANAIQKKGVANNLAYAKSLDAVGLSAKKAAVDLQAMNAAQFMGKRGMTSWAGRAANGGMMAGIGNASMNVAGMGAGAASSAILVTIAASLASIVAITSAIKVAQGKDASNPISDIANKALGFDNETASMGTALFDFVAKVEESGNLLGAVGEKIGKVLFDKVDEFKKIDFWHEVTKFLTGSNGEHKSTPVEERKIITDDAQKLMDTYDKQTEKMQRLNETFGLTERQIRNLDLDREIEKQNKLLENMDNLSATEVYSAVVLMNKLELDKELMNAAEDELESKKRSKEVLDKYQEEEKRKADAVKDVITGLMEQKATLGMTNNELVRFNAAMNGATESQLKAIDAHQKYIDAYEKDAKAKQTIADLKEQEQLSGQSEMYKRIWQESKNGASRKQLVEIQDILNRIAEKNGKPWEFASISEIMRKTGNKNYGGFSGVEPPKESKKLEDQLKDMGTMNINWDLSGESVAGAIIGDQTFLKKLGEITKESAKALLTDEAKKVKN